MGLLSALGISNAKEKNYIKEKVTRPVDPTEKALGKPNFDPIVGSGVKVKDTHDYTNTQGLSKAQFTTQDLTV